MGPPIKQTLACDSPPLALSPSHQPVTRSEGSAKQNRFHATYAFNRLGESIADTLHKGDHVLVDGMLVSSKDDRENGKSKKAKAVKVALIWSVRANSVRRLSRINIGR